MGRGRAPVPQELPKFRFLGAYDFVRTPKLGGRNRGGAQVRTADVEVGLHERCGPEGRAPLRQQERIDGRARRRISSDGGLRRIPHNSNSIRRVSCRHGVRNGRTKRHLAAVGSRSYSKGMYGAEDKGRVSAQDSSREAWWACGVALMLIFIFVVRAPFTASFWLDETISAWIVQGSPEDVVRRSMAYQGQSPFYYLLLWATGSVLGTGEAALRSLSFACCALSLAAVFRIAHSLSGQRTAGFVAVGALLCINTFQDALLSARPYALGFLGAMLSVLYAHRLLAAYTRRDVILFMLSCLLTFYAHYLFSVIFAAHLWHFSRQRGFLRRMAGWLLAGGVAAVLALPQLAALFSRRDALMFAQRPDAAALLNGSVPVPAVVSVLVGMSLALVWGGRYAPAASSRRAVGFLVPYIAIPVLVFAVWSFSGAHSMWVSRYWMWQAGVWAIFLAVQLTAITGPRGRAVALIAAACFFALRLGTQVRVLEDWRGAARLVQGTPKAVALYSGLIEVEGDPKTRELEFDEYVRAPLRMYGVTGPIEVISLARLQEDVAKAAHGTGYLVVLKRRLNGQVSTDLVPAAARQAGMTIRPVSAEVLISVFESD